MGQGHPNNSTNRKSKDFAAEQCRSRAQDRNIYYLEEHEHTRPITTLAPVQEHLRVMRVSPVRSSRPSSSSSEVNLRDQTDRGKRASRSPSMGLKLTAKAIYSYTAIGDGDISFIKGDKFEVIDDKEPEWWNVKNMRTEEEGYIPINYVAEDMTLESEDWFFGSTSRQESVKLLMSPTNPIGTYLIRFSERSPQDHILSVKNWSETYQKFIIKHFKIHTNDDLVYIHSLNTFPSVQLLIQYYTKTPLGHNVLIRACPKPKPQMWDISRQLKDQWEIDCSEITKHKKIGSGNFADVWKGTWNGKKVAIKSMKQGSSMSKQAFLEEAAIMKKFRHDRLVALYAVCTNVDHICIIQEFMNRGSLLAFLRNPEERENHTFQDLIYIAEQIASGMAYLESRNLLHRDLAARNVLMGDNNIAKIGDFGLAKITSNGEYISMKAYSMPLKWTAPEIYNQTDIFSFSTKSDVWSYGILLMELFTLGDEPYPNMKISQVLAQVPLGYRMKKPDGVIDAVYDVMVKCWDANPDKRPTFKQLKSYCEQCESYYT